MLDGIMNAKIDSFDLVTRLARTFLCIPPYLSCDAFYVVYSLYYIRAIAYLDHIDSDWPIVKVQDSRVDA